MQHGSNNLPELSNAALSVKQMPIHKSANCANFWNSSSLWIENHKTKGEKTLIDFTFAPKQFPTKLIEENVIDLHAKNNKNHI